ncbi:MAG: hypothetical protein Q7S13_05830 [Candidatus Omnitrophota bacterium]|nr:hypothetical protein [Candidatus Omnitrophota bacterium]
MRLEGIKALKEANEFLRVYLPRFNKKFNVAAKDPGNYHRSAEGVDLNEILSIQTEHVLRNDRTVVHQKRWYQVLHRTRAQKVKVHEYLNGRMVIKYGNNQLQYKPINKLPKARKSSYVRKTKAFGRYATSKERAWHNNFKLSGSLRN